MSLACFDTLVGLSATDYDCFTDERPDDYNTSDSGYFLTDTDYGLTVAAQCSVSGWGILQTALEQSIRETKTELRTLLRTRYDGAIKPFSGIIGKLKSNAAQVSADGYIGIRLRMRQQRGAKLVIRKIYLALNTAGTYPVTITSNDPLFTAPDDTDVTITTPNIFTPGEPDAPIELPMWSDSNPYDYLEYYISIERGSVQGRNNNFKCCGDLPAWLKHMEASGFSSDTNTPAEEGSFSSVAYGFALDAYLTCEELDWICTVEEMNGFHVKDVLARAIQFRGAALAISALLDTLQVSPCTGYQAENLNSRRNWLNTRWAQYLNWLTENVPPGATDCFTCKPEKRFINSRLIV